MADSKTTDDKEFFTGSNAVTTTCLLALTAILFFPATTTASTPALACYECEETFTRSWDPYTDCQVRPQETGLKECLSSETYCMVERITVKQITISIKRQCTKECWYGCRAKGFGLTQVLCTSCCQNRACNTGNQASRTLSTLCMIGFVSCLSIATWNWKILI